MATFPGDMNIGWGFGLQDEPSDMYAEDRAKEQALEHEAETAYYGRGFDRQEEPQPTDPLLAVSELEQRVNELDGRLLLEQSINQQALIRVQSLEQRVTDLEERLRSLVFVVNILCSSMHDVMHQEKD